MLSEMRQPEKFNQSLTYISAPFGFRLYFLTGTWSYSYLGNSATGMMITNLTPGPAYQAASFFLHIHMLIAFTLQGIIVSQKFHRVLHPNSVHDYNLKGYLIYFLMTLITVVICFVISNIVPFFVSLTGLIGAMFTPWIGYIIPYAFVLKGRQKSKRKTSIKEYVFIIGMTIFMLMLWGIGIASSIISIIDQWSTFGKPFQCSSHT